MLAIVREALFSDDRELALQAGADVGAGIAPVSVQDPRLATCAQNLEGISPLEWIGRKDGPSHRPIDGAPLRQSPCVLDRLRRVGEARLHFLRAQERAVGLGEIVVRHAIERRVSRDRAERVVDAVLLAMHEVDVVGRDAREPLITRPSEEPAIVPPGHELRVDGELVAQGREEPALLGQE